MGPNTFLSRDQNILKKKFLFSSTFMSPVVSQKLLIGIQFPYIGSFMTIQRRILCKDSFLGLVDSSELRGTEFMEKNRLPKCIISH